MLIYAACCWLLALQNLWTFSRTFEEEEQRSRENLLTFKNMIGRKWKLRKAHRCEWSSDMESRLSTKMKRIVTNGVVMIDEGTSFKAGWRFIYIDIKFNKKIELDSRAFALSVLRACIWLWYRFPSLILLTLRSEINANWIQGMLTLCVW